MRLGMTSLTPAQKINFSHKDLFSKSDKSASFLQKILNEKFIFL